MASVTGEVYIPAPAGDASQAWYVTTLKHAGTTLASLSFYAPIITPPSTFTVNQAVAELVTVHIGDTLAFDAAIRADLGGNIFKTAGAYECWIDMDHTGRAQLAYAKGFEDILINSRNGAQVGTLAPEPATVWLVLAALAGLIPIRRRGK